MEKPQILNSSKLLVTNMRPLRKEIVYDRYVAALSRLVQFVLAARFATRQRLLVLLQEQGLEEGARKEV